MKKQTIDCICAWQRNHLNACLNKDHGAALQYQSWVHGAHAIAALEIGDDEVAEYLVKVNRKMDIAYNEAFGPF